MRKTNIHFYLVLALSLLLPAAGVASPKAAPEAPVYTFAPVPEGQNLSHEFVIKNTGDEELRILDVIPP